MLQQLTAVPDKPVQIVVDVQDRRKLRQTAVPARAPHYYSTNNAVCHLKYHIWDLWSCRWHILKERELTLSVWCSAASKAATCSCSDTTSRNCPQRAMSREQSWARFMFTSSANSSGDSAFCWNINTMKSTRGLKWAYFSKITACKSLY